MYSDDQIFDNEAVTVQLPEVAAPLLVICEHASNHMPSEFNQLGLDAAAIQSHVAWDPGALPVAKALAEALSAPLIAGAASRLLFDCNRPPAAPDAIPAQSEIFEIPGNQALSDTAIADRVARFHDPFNAAMRQLLQQAAPALLITVHSFTPLYYGQKRDVEIGVLHDSDSRFADAMLACAADHTDRTVLRNAPYGPQDGVTHTLKTHALPQSRLNVMLEIRNDLITDASSQAAMAKMLTQWVADSMTGFGIAIPERIGSCRS